MEIIITHRNADFDAIASQVAASRLYPNAVMVSAGGVPPIVRKFLTLHRDHFERMPVTEIDLSRVTKMIVVDVRRASRLVDFKPLLNRMKQGDKTLDVHIYDHHGAAPDDIKGQTVQVEPVGSATTLLVERLMEKGIPIDPINATAMALGIYADTGSLTYASTTVRDAQAATFLLKQGASRTTLRYFLHGPLNVRQRQILAALITTSTAFELNGIKIGISTFPLERSVPGLSELLGEAMMLEGNDANFGFFPRGKSVTIIGRSWLPAVDVGAIMQLLGGGGHHGAGAATLKKTTIGQAKTRFMDILHKFPLNPYRVRFLMSTPCHSLSPDQVLDDVEAVFKQKNISGAPVLKGGALVGILSKRNILSAKKSGRSQLAVSSCMTHEVKTIAPDRSVVRAFEKMTTAHIGRLPVVEDGKVIGIITRNDILKVIYQGE